MSRLYTPDRPIRTLDELPRSGLILWTDFLSTAEDRRLIHVGHSTWRRMALDGEAPPRKKLAGRLVAHAEHIRAIAIGVDWRAVKVNADLEGAVA
jgi:hypothetical protein